MDKKIDKLSKWLKTTIQGGNDAPLVVAKPGKAKPAPKKGKPAKRKQARGGKVGKKAHFKGKPQRASHAKTKSSKPRPKVVTQKGVMRVIPVGGLEEVGKNCMLVEYENDIVCIDMGFQFPEDEMLGVDYVIPDIQYLVERKDKLRAILITHGHLDHIGALPYVLEDLGFPDIYGSKLSIGLVKKQLDEHKLTKRVKLIEIDDKKRYRHGHIEVEWFKVNHSIPDSRGMAIHSPEGTIVHTGDFKFDFTPADGIPSDIGKMKEIGKRGVHMMFSDSTNATKPGHTKSERLVAENLNDAIADAKGRIIIASFASLIGRIQQIIDFAQHHNRKVFLSGRSMIHNVEMARDLGFIKAPRGIIKDIREVNNFPDAHILILTTGSQGEPMAALSRMAADSHAQVKISKGDTVVVSASPIIGNAKAVAFLMDRLTRLGAHMIHNRIMDVHTSGHGQQEDLKMMMTLIKPDHLVPIHGNYFMRQAHALLGPQVGIPIENTHMMDNGNVIELRKGKVSFKKEDIKVNYVVVDGRGLGELGSTVLKDREAMAENGIVSIFIKQKGGRMVGKPIVTTHGFVYQKETVKIVKEVEAEVVKAFNKFTKSKPASKPGDLERYISSNIKGYIVRRLDRRPLISPKIVSV